MAETRSSQDWITSPRHAALIILLVLIIVAVIGIIIAAAGKGGDSNDTAPSQRSLPASAVQFG